MNWAFRITLLATLLVALAWADPQCNSNIYERRECGVSQIPYIVYIEFVNLHRPLMQLYHAAGIIIDRNIVLTRAYHCEVASAATFRVYAGQTYVHPKRREMLVKEYKLHPDRDRKTYDEAKEVHGYVMKYNLDFCLLRLTEELIMSADVQMAPLPMPNEPLHPAHDLFVSGWGPYDDAKTLQGNVAGIGYDRAVLFNHRAQPEEDSRCDAAIRTMNIPKSKDLFCLGYRCKDYHTAYGDDGGPLLDVVSQKVVGMVINVREWDKQKMPQLNAKISVAVNWINEIRANWTVPQEEKE